MAREAVIDSMAEYKGDVTKETRETVKKIIALCEILRRYGKEFTFDKDADLNDQVNALLLTLSDTIISNIRSRAKKATKEAGYDDPDDTVWAFASREINGEDLTKRIDSYSSHLKFLLEGWMAIGYANEYTQEEIALDAIGFAANPEAAPAWKKAKDDGGYEAKIITDGAHFGAGVAISTIAGMVVTGQDAIMTGFTYGSILEFEAEGAVGYEIRRGSTYDCPYCDEHTGIVYPFDEVVLPLHPRCCCYPVPVYSK